MRRAITVAVAAGLLVTANAWAQPATTADHDSGAQVYTLSKKVRKLFPKLANQGIRKRLEDAGFALTSYSSKCARRSKTKLRCRYRFTHRLGDAVGTGPSCGASTVKLVRQGKALSVGRTPANSC